jgi:hypothetical protein
MSKITSFVDNVGRVIVGQTTDSKSKQYLEIKEPAVVNVQVNQQNGQISVQLLPFIFREFIKEDVREEGVVWKFNRDTVVTSDNLELEDAIITQYENIFKQPVANATPIPPPAPEKAPEPEVVKLFDE